MEADLAVVGRDPLFGGGGLAQTDAFLSAATALGRQTTFLYDPHPGLRGPAVTWRRVEALRVLTSPRRLTVPRAASSWVVSTHAYDGMPLWSDARAYACWIGTSVESEWQGRSRRMAPRRRRAAALSVAALRRFERRVLRNAVAVYATSESSRERLADASGRDDIGLLPIPVDVQRFVPAADDAWRATLADPTVVFVGRADDPRKNVGLLLEAARLLPDVRFVLAGAPPRAALPDNVTAYGLVDDPSAVLREGTIFALPSLQEGFGIVAAEALATGLPVATTPSGGPEALVRASGGGCVTEGFDAAGFASAIAGLLRDHGGLERMRERGRAYVLREHSPVAFRTALAAAVGW